MPKKQSKEMLIAEIARLKKEIKKKKKYGLVWEDKPEDVVEQCKTELPVLKEIKNKEVATDPSKPVNILIEGDNYHALSVLNYTHAKKVDVIYIDPPYNTGNKDFIYNDQYVDHEDGYRHSKWLSFMEKRLKLAKTLLKETGVIFISIDDNEVAQLKMLMDNPDLFGEENFVNIIVWKKTNSPKAQSNALGSQHEFVLVYAKNIEKLTLNRYAGEIDEKYKLSFGHDDGDGRGPYQTIAIIAGGTQRSENRKTFDFHGITEQWLYKKETLEKWWLENRIYTTKNGQYRLKKYLSEIEGKMLSDIWIDNQIKALQGGSEEYVGFNTQKPLSLIKRIIKIIPKDDMVVLDFFAGSGTTGEAVAVLNKEDGGKRQYILVTNNHEVVNGKKHKIMSDICYPRIKKVAKKFNNRVKFYRTLFVNAESSDKNRKKLTEEAVEMLCIKEGTFEEVVDKSTYKVFKNHKHYCGIVLDQSAIGDFKKAIKDIKGKCNVYIFSLTDESFDDIFAGLKNKVKISPIPEAILRVYRRIFK